MMRALGIDLAATAAKTGAVLLTELAPDQWAVTELEGRPDDDRLVAAAADVDVVGVDSPLGWPIPFVDAMSAHQRFEPWPGTQDRGPLTHRDTDRIIHARTGRMPLSVSANMLGSVAFRCALLQRRWADECWREPAPRDGSGRLMETYPKAAFMAWGVESDRYKHADKTIAKQVRATMVGTLIGLLPTVDLSAVSERCVESDHVLDALACALLAVAATAGATPRPDDDQRPTALVEGWIHVPDQPLEQFPWRA